MHTARNCTFRIAGMTPAIAENSQQLLVLAEAGDFDIPRVDYDRRAAGLDVTVGPFTGGWQISMVVPACFRSLGWASCFCWQATKSMQTVRSQDGCRRAKT